MLTTADGVRARMEQYRKQLLDAGILEPTKQDIGNTLLHWYFYKPMTALTAFVVNLTGKDDCIEVLYGYASTAFTRFAGDENVLIESGVWDDAITIRERVIIRDEADEAAAQSRIARMHERYLQTEKDELLNEAKAKRKAFIQQIAVKLKPMGFKKKGNLWKRGLEDVYYVMFNAQKSGFGDEYYFNIYIGKDSTIYYGDCYYTRAKFQGMYTMDWQAVGTDEIEVFLNETIVPALEQIVNTPLCELGKLPFVWCDCSCDRRQCERCWVEKNLWEAKEAGYSRE